MQYSQLWSTSIWYFTIYWAYNYNMGTNRYANLSRNLCSRRLLCTHSYEKLSSMHCNKYKTLTCRFAHAGESLWVGISLLVASEPVFLSLEAVVVVAVVVCTGKIGCHTFTSVPLPKAWIAFSVKIDYRSFSISKQMAESRTDFLIMMMIIIPLKMCIYRN